jgi:hypothetical protein
VRGQNSLKNNLPVWQAGFNQKKIDRHLDYLGHKIQEYLESLDQMESEGGSSGKRDEVEDQLEVAENRLDHYLDLQEELKNSPDGQLSTTDPDARAVIKHCNIVEVGYNVQTMVDSKHQMIVFGVWKRQWHFDHLQLKTKKKVEMEMSIAALTYNVMRLLNVKGLKWMKKRLERAHILNKIAFWFSAPLQRIRGWINTNATVFVMNHYHR